MDTSYMTDKWIKNGDYCDRDIVDLRNEVRRLMAHKYLADNYYLNNEEMYKLLEQTIMLC